MTSSSILTTPTLPVPHPTPPHPDPDPDPDPGPGPRDFTRMFVVVLASSIPSVVKKKPTGAAYAQAREQDKQRKRAIRDQRRAADVATREEDAELAAQMKASARLNGEVSGVRWVGGGIGGLGG